MLEGRHFKTNKAKKHTVEEKIDRYMQRLERDNPKRLDETLLEMVSEYNGKYLVGLEFVAQPLR